MACMELEAAGAARPVKSCGSDEYEQVTVKLSEMESGSAGRISEKAVEELLRCDEDLNTSAWSPSSVPVQSVEDDGSIQACKGDENEEDEGVNNVMSKAQESPIALQPGSQEGEDVKVEVRVCSSDDNLKNNGGGVKDESKELQKKENSLYALRRNPKRSRRFIDQEYALDILPTSNSSALVSTAAAASSVAPPALGTGTSGASKKSSTSIFTEKARACTECGKEFSSWKALFGHMRCHPEREWRGIQRPDNLSEYKFSKATSGIRRSNKKQRHAATPTFMLDDDQDEELEALYIKVVPSDNESDTDSIEAAYINGSSGGFNSRGKIITGKRSKRLRQLSKSSLQEFVSATVTTATTPAEVKEERDMARCLVMLACAGRKSSSSMDEEDGGNEEEETSTTNVVDYSNKSNDNNKNNETNNNENNMNKGSNAGSGSSNDMEDLEEEVTALHSGGARENLQEENGEHELHVVHHHQGPSSGGVSFHKELVAGVDESSLVCAAAELLDHDFDGIRMKYECSTCKRIFKSHQALGGHRASHKKVKGCFAKTNLSSSDGIIIQQHQLHLPQHQQLRQQQQHHESGEEDITDEEFLRTDERLPLDFQDHHHVHHHHHLHLPMLPSSAATATTLLSDSPGMTTTFRFKDEFGEATAGFGSRKISIKGHECSICHRVFTSGQALGGHKRCHWGGSERPVSEPLIVTTTTGSTAPALASTTLKPSSTHYVTQVVIGSHSEGAPDINGLLNNKFGGAPAAGATSASTTPVPAAGTTSTGVATTREEFLDLNLPALVEEEEVDDEPELKQIPVRGNHSVSVSPVAVEVIHKSAPGPLVMPECSSRVCHCSSTQLDLKW